MFIEDVSNNCGTDVIYQC